MATRCCSPPDSSPGRARADARARPGRAPRAAARRRSRGRHARDRAARRRRCRARSRRRAGRTAGTRSRSARHAARTAGGPTARRRRGRRSGPCPRWAGRACRAGGAAWSCRTPMARRSRPARPARCGGRRRGARPPAGCRDSACPTPVQLGHRGHDGTTTVFALASPSPRISTQPSWNMPISTRTSASCRRVDDLDGIAALDSASERVDRHREDVVASARPPRRDRRRSIRRRRRGVVERDRDRDRRRPAVADRCSVAGVARSRRR